MASTWLDTLAREDVVENTVVACGVIDGIPLTTFTLEHPFFTLYMATRNGAIWWSAVRLIRWFGFPQRWQALIPVFSVASMLYLKYQHFTRGGAPPPNSRAARGVGLFDINIYTR